MLSTLAGGLVLATQEVLLLLLGLLDSIPAFVRGYRWVAPLLVAVYLGKSVFVEGFCLTRPRFLDRIGRTQSRTLRTVLLANACSYLLVGPLFYLATRPYFGGLETTFDAAWASHSDLVLYYVDRDDGFIKRSRLGTDEVTTLVPYRAGDFVLSEDESTCAYLADDGHLYACRAGDAGPVRIPETATGCFMTTVSIGPENRRIAYLSPPSGLRSSKGDDPETTLWCFDLETAETVEMGPVPGHQWADPIAWSATGRELYVLKVDRHRTEDGGTSEERTVLVFQGRAPFAFLETREQLPGRDGLVVNYLRTAGTPAYGNGRPTLRPRYHFEMGPYRVVASAYMGSFLEVLRNGERVLFVQNQYGLLNKSWPPLEHACATPGGEALLFEWNRQTYLLGIAQKRLGLAARGVHAVLRDPAWRVSMVANDAR